MAKRRLTTAQAAHLEDMSAQRAAKKRCLVNKQPIEVELDTGVSPEIQTIRQRFEQKEAVRQAKNLKERIRRPAREAERAEMVKSREAATAQYQAQVTQLTTALAREALLKARETWVLQSKVQALSGRLTSARAMLTKCHASLVSATQESTALHSQNQALREKLDTKVAENREEARHRQNETRRADHYRCLHHQAKLKVERQRKQAARASKRRPITLDKAKDDAKRFRLKCKGIWKPVVRTGFARLRAHGVSAKKMDKILKIAAKMFGGKVQETVSERTVGRSTHEAGIMGQLQLMHEIKHAESFTLSGDGSSFRNIPHESRHIHLSQDPYNKTGSEHGVVRTLGVSSAVNHKAATQIKGWKDDVNTYEDVYNESPFGIEDKVDGEAKFTQAASAYLSDHAPDQDLVARGIHDWKKNVERRLRGEKAARAMSNTELLQLFAEELQKTLAEQPDQAPCSEAAMDQLVRALWKALFIELGEKSFETLSAEEQARIDFFVRVGCAMHKDLNWTKGGDTAMRAAYSDKELDLQKPIELLSKAAAEAKIKEEESKHNTRGEGSEPANKGETKLQNADRHGGRGKEKKVSEPPRGGVRLVALAAALLNHKDDGRGEQNTWRWWMEDKIGKLITFPDASNVRYGCHCDGATMLLLYRAETLAYLSEMRSHKGSMTFVNIQKNVYDGLQDPPTLSELAVLALYAQALSRPFMAYVRAHINDNALLMGPIYTKIKHFMSKIIDDPLLVIGNDATSTTGSVFGGDRWDSPLIIQRIRSMRDEGILPNLETLFVAFCKGALETMERFTKEYASDGLIAQLTPRRQKKGRTKLANDDNEGAIADALEIKRRFPNISNTLLKAILMAKKNQIDIFESEIIDKSPLRDEIYKYIRQRARKESAENQDKAERSAYLTDWKATASENEGKAAQTKERKAKKDEFLESVKFVDFRSGGLDLAATLSAMTVPQLDAQIDKLIRLDNTLINCKTSYNRRADDGKAPKDRKVEALVAAFEQLATTSASVLLPGSNEDLVNEDIDEDLDMLFPEEAV